MPLSTRFDSSSSSEIWTHLNALDDQGMKVYASYSALTTAIPAPTVGMHAIVADTGAEYRCFVAGTWKLWAQPRTAIAAGVVSPSGFTANMSIASAYLTVAFGRVTYEVFASCTGAVTAGSTLGFSGLPLAMAAKAGFSPLGRAELNPAGTIYAADVVFSASTAVALYYLGNNSALTALTATAPGTWATRANAVMAEWTAPLA